MLSNCQGLSFNLVGYRLCQNKTSLFSEKLKQSRVKKKKNWCVEIERNIIANYAKMYNRNVIKSYLTRLIHQRLIRYKNKRKISHRSINTVYTNSIQLNWQYRKRSRSHMQAYSVVGLHALTFKKKKKSRPSLTGARSPRRDTTAKGKSLMNCDSDDLVISCMLLFFLFLSILEVITCNGA